MPYKDKTKQAAQQRDKWTLWREMQDGFAVSSTCEKCDLPIYTLSEDRFSLSEQRWYHFVDPVALGIRPLGKNDPVYDLVRRCDVAIKHRWIPEAFEDRDGNFQGLDPRSAHYRDYEVFAEARLAALTTRDVAVPSLRAPSATPFERERAACIVLHMTTRQAIIDPRQEAALLDRYGFTYTDRKVRLADIDFERSKQLNGRSETRANPDKIEEYAIKKLDGEVFPYPVLALDRSTGKFLIWSGVHRIGADLELASDPKDRAIATTRCFVVEVPVTTMAPTLAKLKQFSHETNVYHGFATSIAERIHAACDEYEQGGKLDDIAHRFSLRPEDITAGLKERRLNFELRQHGIRPETILRTSDKEAILRLPDEHVMKDVARFVVRHTIQDGRSAKPRFRATQGEVNSLCIALRKEKIPAERLKIITAADKDATKGKKGAPRGKSDINNNPLFIWRGAVGRLTKGFDERTLVNTASTGDEMDALTSDVKGIRSVLDSIEHLIEQKR